MKSDKDIVAAVRSALIERIGQHRYELWFGSETQLRYQETTLTICVPNRFFQDWILKNFRADLDASCKAVLGVCPKLAFEVDHHGSLVSSAGREEKRPGKFLAGSKGSASPAQAPEQVCLPLFSKEPDIVDRPRLPEVNSRESILTPPENSGIIEPEREQPPSTTVGGVPRSSSLERSASRRGVIGASVSSPSAGVGARSGRRFADFESFITGPSNQLARASAEMAAMNPGVISPLVLCGPTGVGKTHLLEAIWTALRRRNKWITVVYLSAEQFTSSYLEALRGSGLPSFRRKYRGVDVLLLDDLQFFAGKKATQVELLYTIEALQQAGRQLVFAASAPPRELRDLAPDLAARLESGAVCWIEPPEYETRLRIVAQYAKRMGLSLPEEVCQWVASHFRNHAWELSGVVCRLHAASYAGGGPLTVDFARGVLGDMLAAREQVVQLADIRKAVCEVFQIDPAGLCGPSKGRRLSYPRMLAMWLARKYTRAALSEIGEFFGRRSHSTVISAQKQVDRWLSQGRAIRGAGGMWNPEEAIRRVEKCLRVG